MGFIDFVKDPVTSVGNLIAGWISGWPLFWQDLLLSFLGIVAIYAFLILTVMFLTYYERKLISRVADRIGPNRTGPYGILQAVADVVKLMVKEDLTPAKADALVYLVAPGLIIIPAFLIYSVIPFASGVVGADINVGLLFIVSIASITTISILMAGWGSRNKYSLLGGMRAVAQMISYEVPMVVALLGPVLLTGSLSLVEIIDAQSGFRWFLFAQPVGLLVYFVAGVAEANRSPFDLPEAESELIAGFHIEYSGLKFALFFLAEYTNTFTIGALTTILFLGGWRGPFAEQVPILGTVYFLIKVYFLVFVFIWMRGTFPRLRIDQLMGFAWKFLLPLALANVLVTALVVKLPLGALAQTIALLVVGLALALAALWLLYRRVIRRDLNKAALPEEVEGEIAAQTVPQG